MKTVYEAINNKSPVVIIKGFGKAADILAYAYQNAKQSEHGQNMVKKAMKQNSMDNLLVSNPC